MSYFNLLLANKNISKWRKKSVLEYLLCFGSQLTFGLDHRLYVCSVLHFVPPLMLHDIEARYRRWMNIILETKRLSPDYANHGLCDLEKPSWFLWTLICKMNGRNWTRWLRLFLGFMKQWVSVSVLMWPFGILCYLLIFSSLLECSMITFEGSFVKYIWYQCVP